MTGTFHRLVNGSTYDWQTHAMIRGNDDCPSGVSICNWNALSVFGEAVDAAQLRRRVQRPVKPLTATELLLLRAENGKPPSQRTMFSKVIWFISAAM